MNKTGILQEPGSAAPDVLPYQATVSSIEDAGPGLRILKLAVKNGACPWHAGQYVRIAFGSFSPRPYSIANAPELGPALEIHIKDSGAGGASTYALKQLKRGETVRLSAAEGDSYFEPSLHADRPLLLIGGGMGIAPLKAVAEAALEDKGREKPVFLYWGVRREDDLYYRAYFEDMAEDEPAFRFKPVVGQPVGETAMADFANLNGFTVFLSGPHAMIEAALPLLQRKGVAENQIYYDEI